MRQRLVNVHGCVDSMNKRLANRNEERMDIKQRGRVFIIEAVASSLTSNGPRNKKIPLRRKGRGG